MALLELANVHTYYGNIHALKGISLKVEDGEIVTLIGSNGAGKTTTLRTISGLLAPREGKITLAGKEIQGLPAHEIVTIPDGLDKSEPSWTQTGIDIHGPIPCHIPSAISNEVLTYGAIWNRGDCD